LDLLENDSIKNPLLTSVSSCQPLPLPSFHKTMGVVTCWWIENRSVSPGPKTKKLTAKAKAKQLKIKI